MADNDWMLWNAPPPKLAQREKRRDLLFSLKRGDHDMQCWLLYHGEFGVEAQWHRNGHLFHARTFMTKALAVAWAEAECEDSRAEGWRDVGKQAI